jgi:hypothetical protein
MKKIIILSIAFLMLIFWLFSCWNDYSIKKEKKFVEDKNIIKYDNIWKLYSLVINNKNNLSNLDNLFLEKKVKRYEIWFNIPFKKEYVKYFEKLEDFDKLSLDIIFDKWNNNIEKLLNIISEKSKLNNNSSLVLAFVNKNHFSEKEYEILKKIKISKLEIQWFNIKWKNKILNNKINELLKKSKTLKIIVIQDYKIFKK